MAARKALILGVAAGGAGGSLLRRMSTVCILRRWFGSFRETLISTVAPPSTPPQLGGRKVCIPTWRALWARQPHTPKQFQRGQLRHSSNSSGDSERSRRNTSFFLYAAAAGVATVGLSYAAVPLYRMFCQTSGFAGTVKNTHGETALVHTMKPVEGRVLRIKFNADTGSSMQWKFRPVQREVEVVPGETALAFFTATNPTDEAVIGVATYNVVPYEAGKYFNKIQCFCFEEQRLNPHEQVDMPILFFVDPEYDNDPALQHIDTILLSYTFMRSKG